jgi:hypothetical protein
MLAIFGGVLGAGNYWEKIQDAMEMAESDHPEARLFDSRPLSLRRRLPQNYRYGG